MTLDRDRGPRRGRRGSLACSPRRLPAAARRAAGGRSPRPSRRSSREVVEAETLPDVRFVDVTKEAGLHFVHTNGAAGEKLLPETMGSGVAFLDYDGDGDQDLLLVNSDALARHAAEAPRRPRPSTATTARATSRT